MAGSGRVAIVGFGLMGGSLGRALKRSSPAPEIVAASREADTASAALAASAADAVADEDTAIEGADVVVYATPVGATLDLLVRHADRLRAAACVVTDLGSVKTPVVERARELGLDRFVGGHPLCGAERSGFGASRPDLYDGARVFLVPARDSSATAIVAALWRAAGAASVETVEARAHDERMAFVSHLPQLLSSTLAACLAGAGVRRDWLGPGGDDVLRLAASDAALWSDILQHNAEAMAAALDEMKATLVRVEQALADGRRDEVEAILARARDWATGRRP